eukprot:CAMPEP_0174725626 /NCGR_PEP_ID=MMETSP1094-20130205/46052_1 /TAXON_ID=156173 /ORGANISM="Chrysochromulina brevifilum, Strain UTEX LB 985" /LENGTH=69 /DNA_ID=CAMNT_0015927067 /DNA_START=271 /DNA_END=481 /DNA_ORIENTATION=+
MNHLIFSYHGANTAFSSSVRSAAALPAAGMKSASSATADALSLVTTSTSRESSALEAYPTVVGWAVTST